MSNSVIARLEPYKGHMVLLKNNQRTNDIISAVMQHHEKYKSEYDKVSEDFWKGDVYSTCKYLYDYCRKYIKYKVEPDESQTVRSPSAILKMGHGDCKHYASFINGILNSLKRKGYPVNSAYRFASYRLFDSDPHHVFVVAKDGNKEIYIDPIPERTFNQHKEPKHFTDKIPAMSLYSISGVGARKNKPRKQARQQKKSARKAKRQQRKQVRKAARKARPKGGIVKRVALAPARNSFLLLLKMNLFRWASKLKSKFKGNPAAEQKLKDAWKKLGGNPAVLMKNINQGVAVWNKRHPNKAIKGLGGNYDYTWYGWDKSIKGVYLGEDIGAVQFAAAAAIVAAAIPIIKKLMTVLKGAGIDPSEAERPGADGMEQMEGQIEEQDDSGGEEIQEDYGDEYDGDSEDEEISGLGAYSPYNDMTDTEIGRVKKKKVVKVKKVKKRPLIRLRKTKPGEQRALISLKRNPAKKVNKQLVRVVKSSATTSPRKVKIKTVNRTSPIIRLPRTAPAKGIPTARVVKKTLPNGRQQTTITDTSYNDAMEMDALRQTNDNHGVDDFFSQVKLKLMEYKTPIIVGGGALLAYKFIISPLLENRPKRRKR